MPEPRSRPFTLADAMILVAATTPSLILLRLAASLGLLTLKISLAPALVYLSIVTVGGACILVGLTLALLILTVRQPRRDRRHAIRGPGFVVCAVVLVASALPITIFAVSQLQQGLGENLDVYLDELVRNLVSCAGPMIISAWLALVLAGRWRPRPICSDRLGRVTGACWVFLYACNRLAYDIVLPLIWWWEG